MSAEEHKKDEKKDETEWERIQREYAGVDERPPALARKEEPLPKKVVKTKPSPVALTPVPVKDPVPVPALTPVPEKPSLSGMTDSERRAYDLGKASGLKGRVEKSMLARGERNLAARQFGDEAENVEALDRQVSQAREPAMIEAEAVRLISSAMHDPNRKQALLHSHIPEKILSNMGELEAIERDSKALYLGQVEDMIVMQTRLAWAMLDLGITNQDKWTMDDFVDQLDNLGPDDAAGVIEKAKVGIDEFERQVELVDENKLWLEGIMQGVDDAFELALSASEKGRAEHAVKNIASIVAGSKNNVDFEDEAARGWWRKMKDQIGRMRS